MAKEEDAEKKSNFDSTVLSDAHVVKGTLGIRLSNALTATQQSDSEQKIVEVLSKEI